MARYLQYREGVRWGFAPAAEHEGDSKMESTFPGWTKVAKAHKPEYHGTGHCKLVGAARTPACWGTKDGRFLLTKTAGGVAWFVYDEEIKRNRPDLAAFKLANAKAKVEAHYAREA